MATTLRTELTKAGCNVATATIIFQDGVGPALRIGVASTNPVNRNGVATTGGTDARLDRRFVQGTTGTQVPRCVAIDSLYIYMWTAGNITDPLFTRIPITAASYTTGNMPIQYLHGTT